MIPHQSIPLNQYQVLSDDRCLGFTKPYSNITCDLDPCGVWRKMRVSQGGRMRCGTELGRLRCDRDGGRMIYGTELGRLRCDRYGGRMRCGTELGRLRCDREGETQVECGMWEPHVGFDVGATRAIWDVRQTAMMGCENKAYRIAFERDTARFCSKSCSEGMQIAEYKCVRSATSDILVPDFLCPERPKPIEVCNHGPCVIDPVSCSNLVPDCKRTYGHDICYGKYKQWAEVNCKATCGVCADRAPPTTTAPDLDGRCGQYLQGGQALELCVTKYRIWGERNCPTTCGPCI
ncbi:hypothetical protein DPMN_146730, partial [Dreissena polymorpha]